MQSFFLDPKIRKAKYLIIRPNPQTEETEVIPFDTKMEVNGYLLGCSNPQECIVTLRLDLRIQLKCQKDMNK
jgi:CRISPR/Cas system-associated exonuclease Cas4 (RecB family)